jgi:hypothetical protein
MAVFDWTFPQSLEPNANWLIDGDPVPRAISEVATPTTLTLTFRVTTDVLTSTLRPLKSDEGKVAVLDTDDGGFRAVDRANGGNTYTLTPPSARTPLRFERDYHVNRYEENLVSQEVGEWTVEVEFIKSANRTDTATAAEALNGQAFPAVFDWTFGDRDAEWKFTTSNGSIVTNRVDAEFLGTGESGVEQFELTTRLTFAQARVLETALSRVRGVRVRQIPDAPNVAVDDTDGDAATVDINAPGGGVVTDGAYVVREYDAERISDAYNQVSLTIATT